MKRFLILISVLVLVSALASCGKKKKDELPAYEEQVSKEIKAEEGGKVESSDGKTSVDIPAGALDEDTTITMTIYNAEGYEGTDGKKVLSKVVDFEPNGTIFKKPVIITMSAGENVEGKTIVAAVYNEKEEKWSYSQGFYLILDGKTEAGDPIMHTTDGKEVTVSEGNLTTAAGDPIMMTNAAGDPIMTNAAGDPIMMSAAGDPIMLSASGAMGVSSAGDPIMNSAAGDPIMMTTGHFTAYVFAVFDPREKEEEKPDDDEPVEDDDEPLVEDDDEPVVEDDDEPVVEDDDDPIDDEDVIPEPEKVFSKVLCTGQRDCGNNNGAIIMCPKEGEPFYGQDANYISRGSCLPHSFEILEVITEEEDYEVAKRLTKDNNTGLVWFYTEETGVFDKDFCESINLDGGGWRLPTPKEFLTIADADIKTGSYAVSALYFPEIGGNIWTSVEGYYFSAFDGSIAKDKEEQPSAPSRRYVCVKGDEYGQTNTFVSKTVNNEEALFDETTNLMWQKGSAQVTSWKKAFENCENLEYAGFDDWRLPNKNEFATLLNYSKTGDSAMSDFPGMEKAEFIVSTSFLNVEADYYSIPWIVNTADGTLDINDRLIGENGDLEESFSVRCVRSDLDPLPADGITECDPKTGYAPCKDPSSGIIWSPRIVFGSEYTWQKAARECRDLDLNGGRKWRLPTIDELRTLVDEEPIRYGGDCEVSTECIEVGLCNEGCETPEEDGFESKLHDYGILISGTAGHIDTYNYTWTIDTESGLLYVSEWESSSVFSKKTVVRCVWDDALNAEQTPYEGDGGLYWSSISSPLTWSNAALYCRDLEEGQYSDWRVPSFDELSQLANCNPKTDNCIPRTDGFYSPFYDVSELWTKNVVDQNFTFYDFMTLETESMSANDWAMVPVRCVRGGNVETQQFPQEGGPHLWSEISGEISSFGEAETYCNNIPQVTGYLPWEVPSKTKLADIVNGDYCKGSGQNSLLANNTCGTFSLEGFSIFGDMVPLISNTQYGDSSQYYVVDFAKGEITLDNSSVYVRCVAEEQSN